MFFVNIDYCLINLKFDFSSVFIKVGGLIVAGKCSCVNEL